MLKIHNLFTAINYILKYIHIGKSYFKYFTILLILLIYEQINALNAVSRKDNIYIKKQTFYYSQILTSMFMLFSSHMQNCSYMYNGGNYTFVN